jgi:hypothetical protein
MKTSAKWGAFMLGLLAFSQLAQAQAAGDIVGIWMPSEGTSYIKIFKEKGKDKFHGKLCG